MVWPAGNVPGAVAIVPVTGRVPAVGSWPGSVGVVPGRGVVMPAVFWNILYRPKPISAATMIRPATSRARFKAGDIDKNSKFKSQKSKFQLKIQNLSGHFLFVGLFFVVIRGLVVLGIILFVCFVLLLVFSATPTAPVII